jgi:hypothetical protein
MIRGWEEVRRSRVLVENEIRKYLIGEILREERSHRQCRER